MDLISVIIPVYKVEKYLCRCIDSILTNTYKDLEIICVNDGSPDKCGEILDQYANSDHRIKVVHQKNRGVSSARNVGLAIATGDYIAFVDPDDWVHEKYFEILLNKIKEVNCDIAICDYARTDDSFQYSPLYEENMTYELLSVDQMYLNHDYRSYIWGKLYASKICKNVLFDEDMKVSEDAMFNVNLILNQNTIKILHVHAVLYSYYVRPESAISSVDQFVQFEVAKKYKRLIDEYKGTVISKILHVNIMKSCLSARYAFSILKCFDKVKECNSIMKDSMNELKNFSLSMNDKIKYRLLFYFPQIYRVFRILDDPTMLDWEKNQRKLIKK